MFANENQGSPVIRFNLIFASLILLLTMVGCQSSPTRVNGRVIAGTVGQAMVVGPKDERLQEPGIPGVEVVVLHAGGSAARGRGVVGQATTGEDGEFSISIKGGKHPGGSVMIRAKGEWIFSSRSQTYLPTNAQKLLCTVITKDGYTPPVLDEESDSQ